MRFSKLGRTDIAVSRVCLGTMTWGEQNTEAEAHEQLNHAARRGHQLHRTTAEMYPVAAEGGDAGPHRGPISAAG